MWDKQELEKREKLRVLIVIIIGVAVLLIGRLAWMQLIQGPQYKKTAESNRIRNITQTAPRGTIYDRNGNILVANRPSFAVSIIPAEYNNAAEATPLLASITGLTEDEINARLAKGQSKAYDPVRLKRDADAAMLAKIQERKQYLPGVIIEAMPVRQYVYQSLGAHVLGYLGSISDDEYERRKAQGYSPNDVVGQSGLEERWEPNLRGVDGAVQIEVNVQGEEVARLGEKAAIPGSNLITTLDVNIQKAAEDALAAQVNRSRGSGEPAQGGCAVVLDVATGGVLALASTPAFDPNAFAAGISNQAWQKLVTDSHNPLTNRAIQSEYPPGSVFKIVTASAALDTGQTNADEVFWDKGVYVYQGWSFYGWDTNGLGKLTLVDALAWSSDPVFYELGRRVGVDRLADYARTFGFGELSGIALSGEVAGIVPTIAWKQATYGEEWHAGETLIDAIGQGYYLATPLQQALLLMAVANRGPVYRPRLVDQMVGSDGQVKQVYSPELLRTVYLAPQHWAVLQQGLRQVVAAGTGAGVFKDFKPAIAGKSGSAETGRGTTHSWFACYAPAEQPRIAVAVLIDEGGEGSAAAAPVVRAILERYFSLYGS